MENKKEIRCLNKNGKVRYISEHLAKDHAYMLQMELTIQDISSEQAHFESLKKEKQDNKNEDNFSEIGKLNLSGKTNNNK